MKLFMNNVDLQPEFVACIVTLKAFYLLFVNLSDWSKFHTELTFLKSIFCENGYHEDFIDKCFKKFLDNINLVKEKVRTVERKYLLLVLPY